MKAESQTKTRKLSRRKILIAIFTASVLITLEIYAHFYVPVHHLPVIDAAEIQGILPASYTDSYVFTGSGCRWNAIYKILQLGSDCISTGHVYIFKIEENRSFWTQRVDLTISELKATLNNTEHTIYAKVDDILYESNYITTKIRFFVGSKGTCQIYFGLRVIVYEETLLGLMSKENIEIPMNITLVNI